MTPEQHEQPLTNSPAPLLAVIEREIRERREAIQKLEVAWRDALVARNLVLVRMLADHAAENRRQLALARAERARYRGGRRAASE